MLPYSHPAKYITFLSSAVLTAECTVLYMAFDVAVGKFYCSL